MLPFFRPLQITIFKYIQDKDVFQKFCGRLLARRLVSGTSVSDDAEAAMITKLKDVAGYEYTAAFQRMFQDISVSSSLTARFAEHLSSSASGPQLAVNFSVNVLTFGSWPYSSSDTFKLPEEVITMRN
jgi:hypothetical protein